MKTYFKCFINDAYMMLDSGTNQVMELSNSLTAKSVALFSKQSFYDKMVIDSTHTDKWESITETAFNTIKTEILASL